MQFLISRCGRNLLMSNSTLVYHNFGSKCFWRRMCLLHSRPVPSCTAYCVTLGFLCLPSLQYNLCHGPQRRHFRLYRHCLRLSHASNTHVNITYKDKGNNFEMNFSEIYNIIYLHECRLISSFFYDDLSDPVHHKVIYHALLNSVYGSACAPCAIGQCTCASPIIRHFIVYVNKFIYIGGTYRSHTYNINSQQHHLHLQ